MDGTASSDTALLLALLAICAVLLASGRATVELLTFPDATTGRGPIGNPTFVAVGTCAIPVLILAWALKGFGLLGFWTMMGGLAMIIACAALLRRRFREILLHPLRKLDALSCSYIAGVLTFLFLLRSFEYPLKETPDYLTPGFDLFSSGVQPGAVPYFGSIVLQPVLYARYVISALVSLLAYQSHSFFFSTGLYLIGALLAPTILLGAYILFRKYLTEWPALAVAFIFCAMVLSYKTWLLRADSLAWISGFACLIVQTDIQVAVRREGLRISIVGTAVLLVLLYLVTFLTDAVVALIVALFAAGLALVHIWELARQRASRLLLQSLVLTGFCAVLTLGLGATFARSYSSCATLVQKCEQVTEAGPVARQDAAAGLEDGGGGLPTDLQAPTLEPPPPYLWAGKIAEITALLAPAAPFIRGISYVGLHEFPSLMLGELERLSFAHILVSAIVFLLCCVLQLSQAARVSQGERAIFWAAAASYILLILFAVGLDRLASGVLAIVIARHTLLYTAFFYWIAVFMTIATFLAGPALSRLGEKMREAWTKPIETLTPLQLSALLLWLPHKILSDRLRNMSRLIVTSVERVAVKRVAESRLRDVALMLLLSPFRWIAARTSVELPRRAGSRNWHGVAVVCLMPAWFFLSINSALHRPLGPRWIVQRLASCVKDGCSSDPVVLQEADLRSLSAIASFVRANSGPIDWVFSNVISESRFGFLTAGRNSLLDAVTAGVPIPEQKAAATRLREFARFARTADHEYLGRDDVRFFVLYSTLSAARSRAMATVLCRPTWRPFPGRPISAMSWRMTIM